MRLHGCWIAAIAIACSGTGDHTASAPDTGDTVDTDPPGPTLDEQLAEALNEITDVGEEERSLLTPESVPSGLTVGGG